MTTTHQHVTPVDYPPNAQAVPAPNAIAPQLQEYLAPILERWRVAKAEADAATERAEALAREVKDACISAQLPGGTKLLDTAGQPAATYSVTTSWRLNTTKLKTDHPEVYAAYAAQTTATKLTLVK